MVVGSSPTRGVEGLVTRVAKGVGCKPTARIRAAQVRVLLNPLRPYRLMAGHKAFNLVAGVQFPLGLFEAGVAQLVAASI